MVRVGQMLNITRGDVEFDVRIDGLQARRGPATAAACMYTETDASQARRAEQAAARRAARENRLEPIGRPDKRGRRQLQQLKRADAD